METEDAVRQWLAGRGRNTARAYRRAAMQFAGRVGGDLATATPGKALDWSLALTAAGKAPATVAAMVAAGWSLYEHLRTTGVYGHENPFTPVFVRRPAVRRARAVTPTVLKRLLGAVGGGVLGARDRALVLCLMGQATTRAAVSYTHLRAHETVLDLVCRLLLEKKKSLSPNDYLYLPALNITTTSI